MCSEMKVLLLSLLAFVRAEVPNGYPARGRPEGPRFDLPEKTQSPQNSYLPPLDPRQASPGVDLSVQGLPDQSLPEPPIAGQEFQRSPVSGAPTSGPGLEADLRNLNERTRLRQIQTQQENFRQIETERQTYNTQSTARPTNRFQPTTQTSTEITDLNQGETLPASDVDNSPVSQRQRVHEYPPELFLNPLAQLRLATYPGQQFGRLVTGVDTTESQSSSPAFEALAHFSALPNILAQQAALDQQTLRERQIFGPQKGFLVLSGDQNLPQQYQLQPLVLQANQNTKSDEENRDQLQTNYQPIPQPTFVQQADNPQTNQQFDSNTNTPFVTRQPDFTGQIYAQQPQIFAQQPQIFAQQPQIYAQQPQIYAQQPVSQMIVTDYQYTYQPLNGQIQGSERQQQLGTDPASDTDEAKVLDEDKNGTQATAVATAFGQRNKPRVPTQYGAPDTGYPASNSQPEDFTTTEAGLTVAQATAVANGGRRKIAKLRSRLPRPLFTLDNSGHLVLAKDQ